MKSSQKKGRKHRLKRFIASHAFTLRFTLAVGFITTLIMGASILLFHIPLPKLSVSLGHASLQVAADRVLATCAKESYPPRCYDTEIPKLMDRGMTMEDAFQVTRLVQAKDSRYYYCHVLAHKLAAKETAKDPDDWAGVIGRCPVGMCSNGCLHGGFQERFRDDVMTDDQIQTLIPQISTICEPGNGRDFTGLEQASCYHALGHLTMYITGANATTATKACDQVAKKGDADYTQTCYEGAYMQIFQPLEPEDFTLVANVPASTTQLAEKFCDSYTGERQAACHRESWPLYREQIQQPSGLVSFCALVPDPEEMNRCYNAMFYVLTAQWNFDQGKITELCTGLPLARRGQCFANSASRFLETDYRLIPGAIALCKKAAQDGVGNRCYDEMLFYSTFNFKQGTPAFNQLCSALPEPWSQKCFNGDGLRTRPSLNDSTGYTTD